jgi:hypothetical protein
VEQDASSSLTDVTKRRRVRPVPRPRKPPRQTAATKRHLFAAVRRYSGLPKKRREELEGAIREEVAPRIDDAVGVHFFGVLDEEATLTSLTAFEAQEAAEVASKRPSTSDALHPEASVDDIEAGSGTRAAAPRTQKRKAATTARRKKKRT